jgi:hypothetical protein
MNLALPHRILSIAVRRKASLAPRFGIDPVDIRGDSRPRTLRSIVLSYGATSGLDNQHEIPIVRAYATMGWLNGHCDRNLQHQSVQHLQHDAMLRYYRLDDFVPRLGDVTRSTDVPR